MCLHSWPPLLALLFAIPILVVADRMVDPLARVLKFSIKSFLLPAVADRMVDPLARAGSSLTGADIRLGQSRWQTEIVMWYKQRDRPMKGPVSRVVCVIRLLLKAEFLNWLLRSENVVNLPALCLLVLVLCSSAYVSCICSELHVVCTSCSLPR